ncbi:hypothetical protein BU24DRAFT_173451 [Aaosphaeria arxii CBS 175.79]|uniref:Uncharacterized protein n=1 Tax=Aaosphaeria arxii CBS 175.79 TaxID=1450172 RepID=A0A6A5XQU1_9PLEO|nr:uncharacterized protein BU24DRAFT_173451 [Aaosphaeria arxii CBS 175.79]KAF2015207.1 hypothetical protein BU24DRAFT_173451 [Aaosphaeria arxii CBS 175.79]
MKMASSSKFEVKCTPPDASIRACGVNLRRRFMQYCFRSPCIVLQLLTMLIFEKRIWCLHAAPFPLAGCPRSSWHSRYLTNEEGMWAGIMSVIRRDSMYAVHGVSQSYASC